MRNYFAPAILQNSKLLAGAEGQLLKGFFIIITKCPLVSIAREMVRDGLHWRGGAALREMVRDGLH